MSHSTVTVILDGTTAREDIEEALTAALAPFDENIEMPRYVKYTREQLIEKGREEIAEYAASEMYQRYLADPEAYAAKVTNDAHLEYISGTAEDGGFPAKLTWTDEQVYASEIQWYEAEDIGPDGEVYSTYNPQSRWDWYVIGGRWTGYWPVHQGTEDQPVESHDSLRSFAAMSEGIRPGHLNPTQDYVDERDARAGVWQDVVRKFDINFGHPDLHPATFALLDQEGVWHEKGKMGMFGIVHGETEQDAWRAEYRKLVDAAADNAWFVLVDVHI